jgi:hypothetical protein
MRGAHRDPNKIELFPREQFCRDIGHAPRACKKTASEAQQFRSGGPAVDFLA